MANRFELGHAAWPILTAAAKSRTVLTYQQLATQLGYQNARVTRAALWPIQDFCIERNLPRLTSIVVNKRTGRPGGGYVQECDTLRHSQERVFSYDWFYLPVPFPPGTLLTTKKKRVLYTRLGDRQHEVPDIDVVVNGRGPYQRMFQKKLHEIYGGCCALCETRHRSFLVASHIVPWAEDSANRLNPRNGILLCRTHDAAFECGLIRINADWTVDLRLPADAVSGKVLNRTLSDSAKRLRCVKAAFGPASEFLARRQTASDRGAALEALADHQ